MNWAIGWLRWLSIIPQSERSPVRFLVRAHACDASLSHQCFSPSLSPFLPLSLKINKIFFRKETVRMDKNPKLYNFSKDLAKAQPKQAYNEFPP